MQGITGVSRGGLYDGVSRLEDPGSLSILHHPQTNSVLDTAARIEELALGHYTKKKKSVTITFITEAK